MHCFQDCVCMQLERNVELSALERLDALRPEVCRQDDRKYRPSRVRRK